MTDRFPTPLSIAAYITAYQDPAALHSCIQSLQNQSLQNQSLQNQSLQNQSLQNQSLQNQPPLQAIYILDNSPDPLPLPVSIVPMIHHHQPQNIGIGHGLTLAIEWAVQLHYHFLWLFDQDSQATPDCLQKLIEVYLQLQTENRQIGIIAPTPLTGNPPEPVLAAHPDRYRFIGQPHPNDRTYYSCIAPITSGALLNLAAAKTIDPPNGELFIDGVDIDYGMRLHLAGYQNYIVTTAILQHNFGTPHTIFWCGKPKILQNYSPLRHYYTCRNHTYLDIQYAQGFWKIAAILFRLKYLSATLFWIIFSLPNHKGLKTWACLKGTYDGLQGRLGKTWDVA